MGNEQNLQAIVWHCILWLIIIMDFWKVECELRSRRTAFVKTLLKYIYYAVRYELKKLD